MHNEFNNYSIYCNIKCAVIRFLPGANGWLLLYPYLTILGMPFINAQYHLIYSIVYPEKPGQ